MKWSATAGSAAIIALLSWSCGASEGEAGASSVPPTDAPPAAVSPSQEPAVTIDYPGGVIAEGVVPGTPNILVITIDTLRADHLEVYGYPRETSPRLTELAAESIVFERAYAPVATTLPSHTSMFTGVYPHEHGVLANISEGRTYQRREDLVTLAQLFEQAGYHTEAVVSAFPLDPQFGLNEGFEGYAAPDKKQRAAKPNTDEAVAALDRLAASEKPGFLWVHYFDPHGPNNPPYRFESRYFLDEAMRAYLAERKFAERAMRPTGQWQELERGIVRYDAEIAYADFQIRRLLRTADASGWLEGAVIAVLADHGEGLNQHGVPGHGLTWEEQLHVPMILHVPGVEARRIPWPVSIVDFAPTLLHVLELPGKDEFLGQVTGVDRFRVDVHHGDARILGQSSPRQSEGNDIGYSLRADRWKLHVSEAGERSLYDLESDPFELQDVAQQHGRIVESLADELAVLLKRQRREVRTLEASDEVEADLRALGYGGR